ncbi:MAG TPA: bifunctional diaminohydroxyphosphoribosylaminopyrimidine deaminase/5-amino-6-(5-phosphoribosylamino)uracil reductase RibD [Syntrophomonadaceae bacterium]|nr:bifunctional diaminohydroxyphosphoribosylaminopyrimidine deaminase/5-amino-6-(5-phosphoribosylamino)uracil reductase RibD [Syntrophomonadaceae bacterium]
MSEDTAYMERALELAAMARGRTSPNPLVGAVVVRDGEIVGEGYHQKAGTPHAEIHALRQAGEKAKNAVLYVTLEPCCHYGKTPPCTDAIIRAGIKKAVVAVKDPNPLVAGKGIQALQDAGIEVSLGMLEARARRLNEAFFKYMVERRPFVTLKAAMSLDGKIATSSGDSKWITGVEAREYVHRLRAENDAIMVGIGTVLADDPLLTVRLPGEDRKPLRLVVDSGLRIPLTSRLVRTAREVPTVVAAAKGKCQAEKKEKLESAGVEVWELPEEEGRVGLCSLLEELGKRGVLSVLLEGGSTLNAAALAAGIVDKFIFFYAPKIIGGKGAPGPFGGTGINFLNDAIEIKELSWEKIGSDLMLVCYPAKPTEE